MLVCQPPVKLLRPDLRVGGELDRSAVTLGAVDGRTDFDGLASLAAGDDRLAIVDDRPQEILEWILP
jgi:hypothetical protein